MDYYDSMMPFKSSFARSCFSPSAPYVDGIANGVATSIAASLLFLLMANAGAQPAPGHAEPALNPTPPGYSALDGELFYQLVLGEINARGGEPGAGFSLILDAARKTKDAKLFERAVNVALQARNGESALQAARAWSQTLLSSKEANRYVLQILIGLNRIGETIEPLKREIAGVEPKDRATAIAAIPRYYARAADKKLAVNTAEQALGEYLTSPALGPAAWTTLGRMRIEAGDPTGVLDAARKGHALDTRADGPAMLALSLMSPKTPLAEPVVRKYLEGKPQVEVRMGYARALLDAQRYAESAAQLQITTTEKPDYAQAWLILGTLELQDKNTAAAEKSLTRYVDLVKASAGTPSAETSRGLVQAYLSLSTIAEQRKDFALAEGWLKRIDNAEDMISAQSRRATMLAKQGKLEEGRKLLRALPEKSAEDGRMKIMAEVQLLRDNKQYKPAYDLLVEKTKSGPPDYDLLYDQAMLAEKVGQPVEMERLLRLVIVGKPEYQHAYNALGYSLAERNIRLPEARTLIQKALELAPDDPFITDSLGWVEFRSGNLAEALRILQGAYKAKPDADIGAHLGEVLWVSGKRDQALAIWRESVAMNADNETLLETLKRLRVKL